MNENNNIMPSNKDNNPIKGVSQKPEPALTTDDNVDEGVEEAKMQARMVGQIQNERLDQELAYVQSFLADLNKENFNSPEKTTSLEGLMTNLGMPGVFAIDRVERLLNLREAAIDEEKILRKNGDNFNRLTAPEQNEIADRIKWEAEYYNQWMALFGAMGALGATFKATPADEKEETSINNLRLMVGNEIEINMSRNPDTQQKAKDNEYIKNLATKIAQDESFLNLMNAQLRGERNIRVIRKEIKHLLSNHQKDETTGNL